MTGTGCKFYICGIINFAKETNLVKCANGDIIQP
jgi:hypothetical protein